MGAGKRRGVSVGVANHGEELGGHLDGLLEAASQNLTLWPYSRPRPMWQRQPHSRGGSRSLSRGQAGGGAMKDPDRQLGGVYRGDGSGPLHWVVQ
jgi:hypothetical protein